VKIWLIEPISEDGWLRGFTLSAYPSIACHATQLKPLISNNFSIGCLAIAKTKTKAEK